MSGYDQNSTLIQMPTVSGTAAALGGPFTIKSSEAFQGGRLHISGLVTENISVQTTPDGTVWGSLIPNTELYNGINYIDLRGAVGYKFVKSGASDPAVVNFTLKRDSLLYTPTTNGFTNPLFAGGGAAPTGWSALVGTGISVPTASHLGSQDGAIAYTQAASATRPAITTTTASLAANTTWTMSVIVEFITGTFQAQEVFSLNSPPAGATVTYPICPANPTGGATGAVGAGVLLIRLVVGATAGTVIVRLGLGSSGPATGTMQFSRPQYNAGVVRTAFIPGANGWTVT